MEITGSLIDLSLANLLKREEENSSGSDETLRYGFQIGEINFVYSKELHCEIVKSSKIYPVPNTPTWMLGLINLRGSLVPVFDLEKYFDFKSLEDKNKLLLVLGKSDKAVAFQLKKYPELLRDLTPLDDLPKLLPKIEGYILSAYQGKDIWLELDKDRFFSKLGEKVCS